MEWKQITLIVFFHLVSKILNFY